MNGVLSALIGPIYCQSASTAAASSTSRVTIAISFHTLTTYQDKSLAEQLHRDNPAEFPDPNHKPEMALALSEFEAFVGFKPLEEIEPLFQIHPLRTFLPSSGQSFDNQMLKAIVHSILSSPGELIATKVNELAKLPREAFGECGYITDLLPRLRKQYGESVGIGNGYMLKRLTIGQDPGTLVALFTMNYLKLNPGEAIYIPPDCIHAYLSGDIIECMARSNNMLTAGFCPVSERAVELFVAALSFQSQPKSKLSLPADPWDRAKNGKTALFAPPLSEFRLLALQMEQDQNEEWPALDGPAIMVVTTGSGRMSAAGENFELKEGFVFFIAHGIGVKLLAKTAIRAFVAFVE